MDNNIGSEGSFYIAKALKKCNLIKKLSLNDNELGNTDCYYIADALKTCN